MKRLRQFFSVLAVLLLAACGGGGDGGGDDGGGVAATAAPAAPSPTLGYGIKTLQFTWPAVSGATYYRLFEDPDGVSGYTQVGGDITATSVDHTIALHRRLNARYIIAACNSAGCSDSAPVTLAAQLIPAIGYTKASNTGVGDAFGVALALAGDGNTLAVGAWGEASNATGINGNQADNSVLGAGAVYVFTRAGSTWTQQAYVKASNTEAFDSFGYALALAGDGNTLAVGAYGEASNATGINGNQADNSVVGAGAVYVFTRAGSTWTQQAYVKASNTGVINYFGRALTLAGDGNTLAVGAYGEASSAAGSGAVYVFTRSGSTWTQQAYVKASNTGAGDLFGNALALAGDGNTLAVGALFEDSAATGINGNQNDNSAFESGAVYVFTRTGSTWTQQAYVKASNTGGDEWFGNALALAGDGNTLAVGASWEDSNTTGINGNQADNSAPSAGAVYVFTRTGSTWTQQAYVKASNTGAFDYFGTALALAVDGNTLAVGAWSEDSNATGINGNQNDNSAAVAGAVYVFTRTGSTWTQQAYVKASNTGGDHRFGNALVLAGDGNTLAVGAFYEDSAATGINGNQTDTSALNSGAVYLY